MQILKRITNLDFELFGVITTITEDYRFVYELNRVLNTNFKRIDDLDIIVENEKYYYTLFEHEDSKIFSKLYCIANRPQRRETKIDGCDELINLFPTHPLLLKDKPKYNFFIKVLDTDIGIDFNALIRQSSKLNKKIYTIENINLKNLKNKQYLFF